MHQHHYCYYHQAPWFKISNTRSVQPIRNDSVCGSKDEENKKKQRKTEKYCSFTKEKAKKINITIVPRRNSSNITTYDSKLLYAQKNGMK